MTVATQTAGSLDDAYPLTALQEGMLFHSEYDSGSATYHDVFTLTLRARYDRAALDEAFASAVARHPVLRTSFNITDYSEPLQLVHSTARVPVEEVDLRRLDEDAAQQEVRVWRDEEKLRHFDWREPPLLRAFVHLLSEDVFLLTLSFHHAILDGWSVASLVTELLRRYEAGSRGVLLREDPPAVSFRDFVAREKAVVAAPEAVEFWRGVVAGGSVSQLPRLPGFPVDGSADVEVVPASLGPDLAAGLERVARELRVPLRTVLLAAHLRVLGLVSGDADVTTGLVTHGRPEHAAGAEVLGLFLNTVPLRVRVDTASWAELIRDVFAAEVALLPHRHFPLFEMLRATARPALFDTLFDYRDFHIYGRAPSADRIDVVQREFFEQTNLPFTASFVRAQDGHGGFTLLITYARAQFPRGQVEAVRGYYLRALADIAAGPAGDPRLTAGYLGADDTARIERWNDTGRGYPVGTLPGLVAAQVARTPDAPAVGSGGAWVSYAQFGAAVNRLARYLRGRGVGPEDVVGVCLERGLEQVVALHAVVAAGAAYLPLEPAYPAERLGFMVADAGARLVLTRAELAGNLPTEVAGATVVCLDQDAAVITAQDPSPAPVALSPDALAYVLYTSGSTGRPKGVGVTHRAIVNRLCWMQEAIPLTGADRVVLKTPFSFDVSVWEFFWPLITGAGVVLTDPAGHRDPDYLAGVIAADRATTIHFVPSMLAAFLTDPDLARRAHGLRRVVCSGEALPPAVADRFHTLLPGVALHNLYGPTEAAVDVTWHTCTPGEPVIPIGRPVANTRIEILDPHTHRVPVGVTGELCIAGVQLARGYLGRPALTAERFIPDPHGHPGDRLYRTGDLARWLPTGDLEYLGRNDHQIKLRGFRIELGEIETHLAAHPEVHAAVATIHHDPTGPRLIAYLVTDPTTDTTDTDWPTRLRTHLPDHMIPTQYIPLTELPLTPNGKLNRAALPPPGSPDSGRAGYVPPRDPVEAAIASIWEQMLGVDAVGVADDFFELGGHSLLALRLTMRIREELGRDLQVATVLTAPTVRQLAEELRRPDDMAPPSRIVPLRTTGDRMPLFFSHALGGQVFRYQPLSARLGEDQPVYTIPALGLAPGEEPHTSLDAMADDYADYVRSVQPHGPYVLGGFCIGGNIALEVARRLRAAGEEVPVVFLIWSSADEPVVRSSLEDDSMLLIHALAGGQLGIDVAELHRLDPDEQLLAVINAAAAEDRLRPDTASIEQARRFVRVFRANAHSVGHYTHAPYDGDVVLLLPADDPAVRPGDDLGWRNVVTGRFQIGEIPGTRFTCVYEPLVAHLATDLRSWTDVFTASSTVKHG